MAINRKISSPIKVGFLTPSLQLGGAERWMLSLAKNTNPKRIEWIGTALSEWAYSSPQLCKELAQYMPIYGGPAHGDPKLHDLESVTRLKPDASIAINKVASEADVIISWGGYYLDTMLCNYIQHYGIRSITVSHCDGPANEFAAYEAGATNFAAVCEAAKVVFSPKTRISTEVIYNGADVNRCVPTAPKEVLKERYGLPKDSVVIGYLGRFSPEKNPIAVAKAVKAMNNPKVYAMYVGDGWKAGETRKEAEELLGSNVKFVPPVRHIGDPLATFDCFVLPSYTEAFSLSMIEAWLSGVPVVTTEVGAIKELETKFGELAVRVPYTCSVEQLVEGVNIALRDGVRISDHARDVAWSNFTAEAMSERWMSYIEKVCLVNPPKNILSREHCYRL